MSVHSVLVDATPPANNGGANITSYTVTAVNATYPVGAVTEPTLPITVDGLQDGYQYEVTVHATNTIGDSAESSPPTTYLHVIPPDTVTNLFLVIPPGTAGNIVQSIITFANPTFTGGAPITSYNVSFEEVGGNTAPQTSTVTANDSPLSVDFTMPATTVDYHVSISPVNSAGAGVPALSNTVTVAPL